ncbi:MAG: Maf family protein [Peptococcaceae bacterium]|nr:Maf family protein [Peptococcaceae bacterium]
MLILASASPRRCDLLRAWGYTFCRRSVEADESFPDGVCPREGVKMIALRKAKALIAGSFVHDLTLHAPAEKPICSGELPSVGESVFVRQGPVVLAADTLVVLRGAVLGKPRNRAHAREMLLSLSGKTHTVLTGVAVMASVRGGDQTWHETARSVTLGQSIEWMPPTTRAEATLVEFVRLSDEIIEWYLDTGEGTDKAAGYAIQGLGSRLIARRQGSESNVIGLPMEVVTSILDSLGVRRNVT